jgi:RNA polymerase sigma-70 factor (sigma-E family)
MQTQAEPVRIEGERLGELYLLHSADATRLAYLLTGNRAVAEDLVQDAFVRLAGRLLHLRHPDDFAPYLRRTVVNLANSNFRRRKVERRYAEREAGLRRMEAAESDVPARETMRRALLGLPPRMRTAIVLRYYEDLTEAATAGLMGCRPGTVKSLVSRGMDRLRPTLEGVHV